MPDGSLSTGAEEILREIESPLYRPDHKTSDAISLTPREQAILRFVAAGKSSHEIAAELVRSIRTVARHASDTCEKLGVRGLMDRSIATAYALRGERSPP